MGEIYIAGTNNLGSNDPKEPKELEPATLESSKTPKLPSKDALNIKSPHSLEPNDPSLENIPDIRLLTTSQSPNNMDNFVGYNLTFKHNHQKQLYKYSLDIEKQRSMYPLTNYVSIKKLLESLKTFGNELSSICVFANIKKGLTTNPNWV